MQAQANGIDIGYELSGNAGGQTVALSHSLGSSMIMWAPQRAALEPKFQTLRFDTRGHGKTSAPRRPYSINLLVKDAVALLDTLDLDKVHWVGLSMGGMIGQGLALDYPQRLHSLTLCNTMAVVREHTKDMWRQRIQSSEQFGLHTVVDFAMERWFTKGFRDSAGPDYLAIREQFLNTPRAGYIGCCRAIYRLNYIDEISRIRLPTHIIAGDQDLATPTAESIAMHERIPSSSLDIIQKAAHLSNIEQAEAFNRSLLNFLLRVP